MERAETQHRPAGANDVRVAAPTAVLLVPILLLMLQASRQRLWAGQHGEEGPVLMAIGLMLAGGLGGGRWCGSWGRVGVAGLLTLPFLLLSTAMEDRAGVESLGPWGVVVLWWGAVCLARRLAGEGPRAEAVNALSVLVLLAVPLSTWLATDFGAGPRPVVASPWEGLREAVRLTTFSHAVDFGAFSGLFLAIGGVVVAGVCTRQFGHNIFTSAGRRRRLL